MASSRERATIRESTRTGEPWPNEGALWRVNTNT
jgi:hypothetical protein